MYSSLLAVLTVVHVLVVVVDVYTCSSLLAVLIVVHVLLLVVVDV